MTAGAGLTRTVVVGDLRFMRTLIRTLLEDADVEVIARTADSREAISVVEENRLDMVTTGIEMLEMNDLDAVGAIVEECPAPVLMLSMYAEKDVDVTFEAFNRGAVDFVTKPGGEVTSEIPRVKRELTEKIQPAAAVGLLATHRGFRPPKVESKSLVAVGLTSVAPEATESFPTESSALITGASTDRPDVVERVLAAFLAETGLHMLIVQHMPTGFTKRFAARLGDRCDHGVREAEGDKRIGPGWIRIAPGDSHLLVTGGRVGRLRLGLSDDGALHDVRSAIDLAIVSVAGAVDAPLAGVLLTGMDRNGVEGTIRIEQVGGRTVARDEATSAISGMPKRAIEIGCVDTAAVDGRIVDEVSSGLTT